MRGKRGEDLIWGGSTQVARGNRAQVSVTLDNSKKVFPLDFSEIKIERVVHRDGQNEYILNGSNVRLKDIQELLASANIGSTGHHIISQGEADRILTANPKERREMIEDALGLKIYQYKRQEAEKKLTKTIENVAQVESLRREAAPHLKYLEKQVQKIEKSLELQERLKGVYAEYLRREDIYISTHHDRLEAELRLPKEALEKVKEELISAKKKLQVSESVNDSSELIAAEEALQKNIHNRQALERELSKLEGQINLLERRLLDYERRSKTETGKAIAYADISDLINDIEQQVSKALQRDEVPFLQRALSDIVHRLKVFIEKSKIVTDQGVDLDKEELTRLKDEVVDLSKKLEKAKEDEFETKKEYEAIEQRRLQEATDGREAERAVFRLVSEQRELETKIERLERELAILDRDRNEFKQELQEAVALLGRAAAQYYDFEIKDESGQNIDEQAIVNEDRSVQRNRRHELEKLKIRLEELGIGATEDIIKEYNDAKERDAFLAREIVDLETSITKLRELIDELQGKIEEQFVEGIKKISSEFNRFFTLMFGGGEAELVTVETKTRSSSEDELSEEVEDDEKKKEEGIELVAKLPNKRVKGLEMLSGGERALTSIALIFAMSQVNPPPFIILDETDAALDEANSRRYGDMIEELAKKSQLILITHNRETMSRAGILYGVTMGSDGISKLLSVKLDEAVAVAK
jgi:chromosome segregation protein